MEFARKMILVPAQEFLEEEEEKKKKKKEKNDEGGVVTSSLSSVQTPGTATTRLDEEMSKILNSPLLFDADVRQKCLLYQQVLQRFLHLKEDERQALQQQQQQQQQHPPPGASALVVVASTAAAKEKTDKNDYDDQHIIESVPAEFRSNAKSLVNYLRNSGNIKWNNRGTITLDGAVVKGANIVDLVNEAMRSRKRDPPHGYEQFARVLRQVGIPREFVGNDQLWSKIASLSFTSEEEGEEKKGRTKVSQADKKTEEEEEEEKKEDDYDDDDDINLNTSNFSTPIGSRKRKADNGCATTTTSSDTPYLPKRHCKKPSNLKWTHM